MIRRGFGTRRHLILRAGRWVFPRVSLPILLLANGTVLTFAQTSCSPDLSSPKAATSHETVIDNDALIRMNAAGLSEDILLQIVQNQRGRYDTTPSALAKLRAAGLSEHVLSTIQALGTGLKVRRAAPSRPAPAPFEALPGADFSGIEDIGIYYKDKSGQWFELKMERVTFKSGGALKNILSGTLIKQDMNGHIDGNASPLTLPPGTTILLYTPYGTMATEYEFLQFRVHSDNREFRTNTGGVFHSQTGPDRDAIDFNPQRLAPQIYTFKLPADLVAGEYGILAPASSNQQSIAGAGKIYTFSVSK